MSSTVSSVFSSIRQIAAAMLRGSESGQEKAGRKIEVVVHNSTTLDGEVISRKTRRCHYKGLQALL
jgi:hypothetical protein